MRDIAACALLVATLGAVPAAAGTITETIGFSLGGFVDVNGDPPLASPTDTVSGSFTITFDPARSVTDDTADLVVHAFRGAFVASAFAFSYFADVHFLLFGGLENGADFVRAGTDDFVATLDLTDPTRPGFVACGVPGTYCGALTGSPLYDASGFTTAGTDSLWFIPVGDGRASVPEPGTVAVLSTGVLALALRRRAPGRRPDGSEGSAPGGRAGW